MRREERIVETPNGLLMPKPETLRKYGLGPSSWFALAKSQGFVCAICGKLPSSCRLVIDHHHVTGWKQMPPEQKALWVRGLLCWVDNEKTVGRGMTPERLRAGAAYLERPKPFNAATVES